MEATETSEGLAPPQVEAVGGLSADGRLRTGRLAGLTMGAAIFTVAWPVLVDSVLGSLVGLVDTILAAGISEPATDAVGDASYLMWFIGLVFVALDVGATALISRSIGAGRRAVANAAVGQTMLLAAASGTLVGLLVFLMVPVLIQIMRMEGQGAEAFHVYMRIIAVDSPIVATMYAGIACLRGSGDSFRAMRALLVVNAVNMLVAWTLAGVDITSTSFHDGVATTRVLLHNPFPFKLGVAGIGIGTLTAHATGAALVLATLLRGSTILKLHVRRLRPHTVTMWRIVRVGLPNFFETIGMWFGNFLIVLVVGWMGAGLVGAHIIAIRIEAFSFQLGFAIAIAATTLTGQYLGAGSAAHARRAIVVCSALAAGVMGLMGIAFVLMPRTIVGLVSGQATHLALTPQCLFITGMVQVPFAISIVLRQAMRGAGDVKVVMWITWITTYACRLPLVYIFSGVDLPIPSALGGGVVHNPFGFTPSLRGLWIGLCSEIVFRAIAFGWRFIDGGWARKRV